MLVPTGPVGKRKRTAAAASMSAIADAIGDDDSDDSDLSDDERARRRKMARRKEQDREQEFRPNNPIYTQPNISSSYMMMNRNPLLEKEGRRAMKRTKHLNLITRDLENIANHVESLVPIRLDIDVEGYKLKDTFMWNLKEKYLQPQRFAEMMCEDLDLPVSLYASQIAEAITTQIEEHTNQLLNEIPPEEDMRIFINLDIIFGTYAIRDRFEWDLASELTPEEFAQSLAADLGLGGEFPGLVAHSIHEQIQKGKAVIASGGLEDVDGDSGILGMLKDSTRAIEDVFRDSKEIYDWGPLVESVSREQVERLAQAIEKERGRRNRRDNRGTAASRRRSYMPAELEVQFAAEPEDSWASTDDRNNWKCSHCLCKGKQTNLPRKGPLGPKTLCNSCGLFFKTRGVLPGHRMNLFFEK